MSVPDVEEPPREAACSQHTAGARFAAAKPLVDLGRRLEVATIRISVAMCTYYGAKHLSPQLRSLLTQELPIDELVIVDDASDDSTPELLQQFVTQARLDVHLYRNDVRLGVVRNFERAIRACTGDVIFLCDQDDVWHPQKTLRIAALLEHEPDVGLVFSDAQLVDADLHPLGATAFEVVGLSQRDLEQLRYGDAATLLAWRQVITGATVAFRARHLDLILPFPSGLGIPPSKPLMIHDGWIALAVSCAAPLAGIDEPLIDYRQHSEQLVGLRPGGNASHFWNTARPSARAERWDTLELVRDAQRLLTIADERAQSTRGAAARRFLDEKHRHFEARCTLPPTWWRRLRLIAQELVSGRYRRHSSGVLSAAKDLLES